MRISEGQTTLPVRRVPAACRYSGLSRSILYRLIGEGKIKSVALRDKGKLRGIRLVAADSIDRFLESIPGAAPVPQREEGEFDPLGDLEGNA
jgi:hypothetical protein